MISNVKFSAKPQVVQWAPTMSPPAPLPGLVWTTAPYRALLRKSGLISAQLPPTVDRGLKLYPLQLTPEHIRQAATQLAAGRTAMGPLSQLEKAKQLSVSASEIRLGAKRVEALLGTAEGISMGWEALAKVQPSFDEAAGIAGGVVAGLNAFHRFKSSEPVDAVESVLGYTIDALLILNALASLLPHGEQVKRAAPVLALVVKGTSKVYTAWHKPIAPPKP